METFHKILKEVKMELNFNKKWKKCETEYLPGLINLIQNPAQDVGKKDKLIDFEGNFKRDLEEIQGKFDLYSFILIQFCVITKKLEHSESAHFFYLGHQITQVLKPV